MTTTTAAHRRARSAVLGLLVLLGTVGLGATAAQAHDVLVSSDPAEGAVLDTQPAAITLSFNNPPLEVGSAIAVVDAAGTTVVEGAGTVDGTDVSLALDTDLPAGALEVRWRVASSDGHPIDGVIPFELAAAAEPATTEAPTATEAPTTEAATPASEPTQVAEETGLAGLPTAAKVAIAVAALGSVAALVVLIVRRQRTDRL